MGVWFRFLPMALICAVVGCGGAEHRPPATGAVPSTAVATAPNPYPSTSAVTDTIIVNSRGWPPGQPLAPPYGCVRRGDPGDSPPLSWSGAAPTVRYYAVTVLDPDADNFVHWAVLNLPASTTSLPPGATGSLPKPARELRNGFGRAGYGAPCPPLGQTHHYVLTVWALRDAATELSDLPRVALANGQIIATYRR